jgi:hypothetical protein
VKPGDLVRIKSHVFPEEPQTGILLSFDIDPDEWPHYVVEDCNCIVWWNHSYTPFHTEDLEVISEHEHENW